MWTLLCLEIMILVSYMKYCFTVFFISCGSVGIDHGCITNIQVNIKDNNNNNLFTP